MKCEFCDEEMRARINDYGEIYEYCLGCGNYYFYEFLKET